MGENDGTLVVQEVRHDLSIAREPEAVLAEAQRAAKSLKDVIAKKEKPVIFNGQQYLEFEDWQTCGKFYGITAKIVETKYVEFGDVKGFEARAVAYHIPTGQEVSAADAMCLSDEPNWNRKPLFQLRSMAQTRACAKALRNVLAWVVVLAGYKPTPAEEMDAVTNGNGNGHANTQATHAKPTGNGQKISDKQRKRFYAIWKSAGKDPEAVKAYLKEHFGSDNSADITMDKYEDACLWAEGKHVPGPGPSDSVEDAEVVEA